MKELLDAFWRAAAYCLHPRVIFGSLAPVLVAGAAVYGLGWFYWEPAVDAVRETLSHWTLTEAALGWLDTMGFGGLRALVAPLVIVAVAVPVVVVMSLLLVALLMTPAIVNLVAGRRFPALERKRGAGWVQTSMWSVLSTLLALLVLVLSLPLWLIPPLALVLPPLIWGWLTYRVFAFEVLAGHASADERRRLLQARRGPLLVMGVVAGYMGAAPALLWAASAFTLVFAPLLLVASVWLYTLVFAFAAAWFAHYALAALQALRVQDNALAVVEELPPPARPVATDPHPGELPPPEQP
jgi:hypothetical protein